MLLHVHTFLNINSSWKALGSFHISGLRNKRKGHQCKALFVSNAHSVILAGSTVIQIGLCTPPQRISNQTIKIWLEMQIYSFNSQVQQSNIRYFSNMAKSLTCSLPSWDCFYHPEDWAVDFRHALTANYFHPRIIHIPIFKIIKVCPIGCNSWTVNVMHLLKHFQLKLYIWIASWWCTEVKLQKISHRPKTYGSIFDFMAAIHDRLHAIHQLIKASQVFDRGSFSVIVFFKKVMF